METNDFSTENIIFTNNSQKLNYAILPTLNLKTDENKCYMLSIVQYLVYYLKTDKIQKIILNGYYHLYLEPVFKLFPMLEWHLYGTPNSYIKRYGNINVHQKEFDLEESRVYQNQNILYISNYIPNTQFKTTVEEENDYYNNLKKQQKFLIIMKPQSALINFKLPHSNLGYNSVEFFKGTMYKKIFNSEDSFESMKTNLVITNFNSSVKYDVNTYEEMLTYFNRVERKEIFNNPFFETGNLLEYDDAAEMDIIIKYLHKIKQPITYENYKITLDLTLTGI